MEINIGEIILEEELNIGEIELDVIKEYPELEDLTVTPSVEEQHFKSEKYGYDDVTVKAVESKEIAIVPSAEEQVKEGMFNKVTVTGDSDLIPENIKEGIKIFGVEGIAKTTSAKITDASYLFYQGARTDCLKETLELCDKVTNMSYMFYYCTNLTNLDLSNFNTSQVTNMSNMFYNCTNLTNLDLSNFNTSQVTNMSNMFYYCNNLTNLDLSNFNTSQVTSTVYMFTYCTNLTNLDLSNFNTSQVIDMAYMFYYCTNLINLDLSNFNFIRVIGTSSMFDSCSNLTNLKFGYNLGKGYTRKSTNYRNYKLDLSACKLLTHESLMSVINNLYDLNLTYDVANGGTLYTQSLNLGSTNKAKLTDEEIAIATSKGWNVT